MRTHRTRSRQARCRRSPGGRKDGRPPPVQYWPTVLNAGSPYQSTNGTPYVSSAALTDVSPAPQLIVPANFYYVGQLWRFKAWGIYSTNVTPNLTIGF